MAAPHRPAALLAVGLLLSGCGASYQARPAGAVDPAALPLDRAKAVLVATPADGGHAGRASPGSGRMVARQTVAALQRYASQIVSAPAGLSAPAKLLAEAGKDGCAYVVVPTIVNWEEPVGDWMPEPSRLSVSYAVLDAASGRTIDATALDGETPFASFTLTSPQSLLPGLLDGYVDHLYGAR